MNNLFVTKYNSKDNKNILIVKKINFYIFKKIKVKYKNKVYSTP